MRDRPEMLGLDILFGPGVFGKDKVRSEVAFASEKIAYDGDRSEYGLAQPRAAGCFCFGKMGPIEGVTFALRKIAYGVGGRKNGHLL